MSSKSLALICLLCLLALNGCAPGGVTETQATGSALAGTPATRAGTPAAPGAELHLDHAYLIQSQQRPDASIPLMAGRDAYLRAFVRAECAGASAPALRARLLAGDAELFAASLPAPAGGLSTAVPDEGDWDASYNLAVPGDLLRPGLTLELGIDAAAARDANFSLSGNVRQPLQVVEVPTFSAVAVRLATLDPQGGPPLVGNLSAENLATYYDLGLQVLPIAASNLSLRPGTFSLNLVLGADGRNWVQALSDLQMAHLADPNGDDSHWFGLTRLSYVQSGVCGIHIVSGTTGLAEDDAFLDMAWAQQSLAHETGHGLGLLHAPCGNAAGIDDAWPSDDAHEGAKLGTWGLNVGLANRALPQSPKLQLQPPQTTDLMSYCAESWLSDYSFAKALENQTVAAAKRKPTAATARSSHLVIAGRIHDGNMVIDHAMRAQGHDHLPPPGPYQLRGLDAQGATLFDLNLAATPVGRRLGPDDAPAWSAQEAIFAVAVPLPEQSSVSQLVFGHARRGKRRRTRSADAERQVRRHRRSPAAVALGLEAWRQAGDQVRLRWDASLYTKAFVSEPDGHLIGVVRAGEGTVLSDARRLRVELSEGMESIAQSVRVR